MGRSTGSYHHGNLRAALLEEAARMIGEGGVSSVTMRAIGERVGVSRAAPYRHFPDKEALLAAVAASGFDELNRRLEAIDDPTDGAALDQFCEMGRMYVRFALDHPAQYRLMYGEQSVARDQVPELGQAANDLFAHLVALIESQQAAGRIVTANPQQQAYVAWSAVHGLASLLIDGQIRAETDVDALIEGVIATVLNGFRHSDG